jgi:hypothetical protein
MLISIDNFDLIPNEILLEIFNTIIIEIPVDYLIDLCTVNNRWYELINTMKLYMYSSDGNYIISSNRKHRLLYYRAIYMKNHININLRNHIYFHRVEIHKINRNEFDNYIKCYNHDISFRDLHEFVTHSTLNHNVYNIIVHTKYKLDDIEKYKIRFNSLKYIGNKLNYKSLKLLELVSADLITVYGSVSLDSSGTTDLNSYSNPLYIFYPKGELDEYFYDKKLYDFWDPVFNHIKSAPNYV